MSFPVPSRTEYNGGTLATHPVPITYAENDIVLIFIAVTGTPGITSAPAGFTQLIQDTVTSRRYGLWAARATAGGSGNATFVLASAASLRAHVVVASGAWFDELSDADPTDALVATLAEGTSNVPNPPNQVFGWDADTLVIAACTQAASDTGVTYPSTYTDGDNQSGVIATAFKEVNGASEDPGTFGLGSSLNWGTITAAIRGFDDGVSPAVMRRRSEGY